MRDEMDMRFWEAHHADFSAFLAGLIDKARTSFNRLPAVEFYALGRSSRAGRR